MAPELSRREFLRAGGSMALLAALPAGRVEALMASAPRAGEPGRFLTAHELRTLRAATARFIPGPPEDPDPGAVEAHAAEAIDLLLGAFEVKPPLIHAGGPFSGRAGGHRDDFAHFLHLDRQAALGWRIRLEGSQGRPEREFGGPVRGLQEIYREGLAHLDERSRSAIGMDFADAPFPVQDAILSDQDDDRVQEFVGAAFANTLDAVYGPPEYGGNHNRVGWKYTGWPGDSQPRGYTPAQVSGPAGAGAGKLSASTATALERFLPGLAPRPSSRDAHWLSRRGLWSG
jgi:hypothetical protein